MLGSFFIYCCNQSLKLPSYVLEDLVLIILQHINGATRMILEEAGVIDAAIARKDTASKSNTTKKGKK
jgi:hypothetical protein